MEAQSNGEIFLEGKKFISLRKASLFTGYHKDYLGQICRQGLVTSQRIGNQWFVEENSLLNYESRVREEKISQSKIEPEQAAVKIKIREEQKIKPREDEIVKSALKSEISNKSDKWDELIFGKSAIPIKPKTIFAFPPPFFKPLMQGATLFLILGLVFQNPQGVFAGIRKISDVIQEMPKTAIKEVLPVYKKIFIKEIPENIKETANAINAGSLYYQKFLTEKIPEKAKNVLFKSDNALIYRQSEDITAAVSPPEEKGFFEKTGSALENIGGFFRKTKEGAKAIFQKFSGKIEEFVGGQKETITPESQKEAAIPPRPKIVESQKPKEPAKSVSPVESELANLRREVENLKISGLKVSTVVEKPTVIEKTIYQLVSEITKQDFENQLSQVNNKILAQYAELKNLVAQRSDANFAAIALSQRVNTLSNVQISSPTISGSGTISGASLSISGTGGITGNTTLGADLTVDSGTLYVDSANNRVGIGTTSPQYALDVDGALRATSLVTSGQTIGGNLGVTGNLSVDGNSALGNATTSDIVYINSRLAGHLIPTTDNLLDLGDGTNWLRWRTGYFGTSVGIAGTATSTGTQLTASGAYLIDSAGALSINTSNNQNVIFGGGNVGIGTTSPYAKLSVVGQVAGAYFTATTTTSSVFPYASSTAMTISGTASTTNLIVSGNSTLSNLTALRLLSLDGSRQMASVANLASWIGGTTNQLTVTDDGDGSVTLSLPSLISLTQASSTRFSVFDTLYVGGTATTTISQSAVNLPTGGTYQIAGTNVLTASALGSGILSSSLTSVGALSSGSIASGFGTITAGTTTITNLAVANTSTSTFTGGLTVGTSQFVVQQATGNVGIGTISPRSTLAVASGRIGHQSIGNTTAPAAHSFTDTDKISLVDEQYASSDKFTIGQRDKGGGANDSELFLLSAKGNASSGFGGAITFYTEANGVAFGERMRIAGNGNVGIGTTTPGAALHIETANNNRFTESLRVSDSGSWTSMEFLAGNSVLGGRIFGDASGNMAIDSGAGDIYLRAGATQSADGALGLLIKATTGNVGIGTTTPWRKFSVGDTVGFGGLTGSTGAGSLCLSSNKEVVYNSASDACLSSLRATKHDINPLSLSGLAVINGLQPVSFVYNEGDSRLRYGFIAEDAAGVDSHLATYNELGSFSGIDDRAIISVAIKAIKEMNLKIEDLEKKNASATDNASLFNLFLNWLSENIVKVKELIVGSQDKPTGITLYDKTTGAPYCLEIVNGTAVSTAGECGVSQPPTENPPIENPPPPPADTEPPVITIHGNNPAEVAIGTNYGDLGASAQDNINGDISIFIRTYVNGQEMNPVQIDTSATTTYNIEYAVSDSAGNAATSSRRVVVYDPYANSTSATSTSTSTQ